MDARSKQERSFAAFLSALALSVPIAASSLPARGAEPRLHIEVGPDQRVRISGRSPSLAATMAELAWRAGFELRGFDAEDQPVAVHIEDCPLWQALPRLLGSSSFLAGTTPVGEGRRRVMWLRVLGPHDRAHENRRLGHGPATNTEGFRVPPALFLAAFATGRDAGERRAALQSIAAQITGNPDQRRAFLETDSPRIAKTLEDYPEAAAILDALAAGQRDVALKEKLKEVLVLLETGGRSASPVRGRAATDTSAQRR